jgi:formylglycine-generating enzyme required for sulfatase activity
MRMGAMSASVMDRLNAALEGRYRIERKLGEGGMATVYLTRDLKHGRNVAIKVLSPELAALVGAERFLAEIEMTAGLAHPHIVPLFDSGEVDGLLYYVMPVVEGESLRDHLKREGRLPVEEALAITKDVAAALSYAHARGVVHRDIKPANVLIEDGEALVADFGIAVALSSADSAKLTATGLSVGTPGYMSPEQIGGEAELDGRSDVYALGCLLYEMLTGEPPFTGASVQAVVTKALTEPPPSVRVDRPDVPMAVDETICKALAKRPEDRFATPRELYEACAATPTTVVSRRMPRVVIAIAAVVVVAVGYFAWRTLQVSNARGLLPEIGQLADAGRYVEAYELAVRAERWIGADSALEAHMFAVSDVLTVTSQPEGADVFLQRFPGDSEEITESRLIGSTPIVGYRMPRVDHRVVVATDGSDPVERIASSGLARELVWGAEAVKTAREITLAAELHPDDMVPADMVLVPGGEYEIVSPDAPAGLSARLDDFHIDRYEVTNGGFKEFLLGGGYTTDAYWAGTPLGIRPELVDRTGLSGPRSWQRQDFPAGEPRFPVSGISWYEASAYCSWAGKRLPTLYEWEKTARDGAISRRGVLMPWGFTRTGGSERRANFNSGGAVPVDAFPFGISPHGAYGMAGNVREWVANPLGGGYATVGGSWEGPSYLYTEYAPQPGEFDSPSLGFRCARSEGSGDQGVGKIDLDQRTPAYNPVDEATFRSLLAHYRYDRRPANPRVAGTKDAPAWTRESIWIDGPGADSLLLYFYAPKGVTPPYQTIVYVPGASVFCCQTLAQEMEWSIGPAIQAGRAVLAVVLTGMLERPFGPGYELPSPSSVGFRDLMVQHATELRLGIDYIETREDVDASRLAYVAVSFGAGSRLAFSAVDDRYRSVVYIGGGIDERMKPNLPEADNVNFAPYVSVPKLLINGRSDEEHPWYTKELVLVDGGGHVVPLEERIPAINGFLDRTLGPVGGR